MRNNSTALAHPTMQRKLRYALWLAKLEAMQKHKRGAVAARGTQYIQNRKGHNVMRLDWNVCTGVTVWGDQSRNITGMVCKALGL